MSSSSLWLWWVLTVIIEKKGQNSKLLVHLHCSKLTCTCCLCNEVPWKFCAKVEFFINQPRVIALQPHENKYLPYGFSTKDVSFLSIFLFENRLDNSVLPNLFLCLYGYAIKERFQCHHLSKNWKMWHNIGNPETILFKLYSLKCPPFCSLFEELVPGLGSLAMVFKTEIYQPMR